jgi:hypothetical protein
MSRNVVLAGSTPAVAVRLLLAAIAVVVLAMSTPAAAVEGAATEGATEADHGPAPSIDQVGTQNEVSQQYKPEPAEAPPFMRFFYIPLAVVGIAMIAGLLFAYLTWQPRFAEERRSKRRR